MSHCGCEVEIKDASQRGVLYWLLAINAVMFLVEFGFGWIAESTALIADSLDMLADALVYLISLYAVGQSATDKAKAARQSGYFQLLLGLLILVDIVRRVIVGNEPVSLLMMGVGGIALIANLICLLLIYRHKDGEVHMRAGWIFSTNDVIANLGVIISGGLVWWLGSRWPDIIIGLVIAGVILRGAILILRDAKAELAISMSESTGCCSGNTSCQGD